MLQFYKTSNRAYDYCFNNHMTFKKDDSEVAKYLTDPFEAYSYCKYFNDNPEVSKRIPETFNINDSNTWR